MPPKLRAKPSSSSESDTKQNSGGEAVTMETVQELLRVQESMFKALFEATMNTVNKRIDDIVTTVSDLKASLEFTQKDVQEIKPNLEKLLGIEQEILNTQSFLSQQKDKVEYLENQSRRNNIRLDGVPEVHDETWEVTEQLVKDVLKDKLEISEVISVERAHRIGKRRVSPGSTASATSTTRPRTIVCRLENWKQKD
jgi:hypothetical protein